MPVPTEVLAEQIEQTNRRLIESNNRMADEVHALGVEMRESNGRLAAELRESNLRLAEAIGSVAKDLGSFRVEVAKDLGAVRAEMATVNGTLGRLDGRLDHSLSVAKWTVGVLTPVILGLIGTAIWLAWAAAKLDSRVEHIEKAVGAAGNGARADNDVVRAKGRGE